LADHQRFKIDEIKEDGEPIAPKENVHLFVNQCGVIIRDKIPITTREWNKPKVDGVSYVDQRCKYLLWDTLLSHFNLPPEEEPKVIEPKLKEWFLRRWPHNSRPSRKYYKMTISRKKDSNIHWTTREDKKSLGRICGVQVIV
jgi:hypothetical protein